MTKNRFIVGVNGSDTVRTIGKKMGVDVVKRHRFRRGGKPWRINGKKQPRGFVPTPIDGGITINWGNGIAIDRGDVVYNNPQAVSNAANKALARSLMSLAGVNVPRTFSVRYGHSNNSEPLHPLEPVVVRPLRHRAGKSVRLGEFGNIGVDEYKSEIIDKVKEYRVHVGSGKLIILQEKVADNEIHREDFVWNHANGNFTFNNVRWADIPIDVARIGIDSVAALGLDYGAVDVIVDGVGNVYTLEVNTSPSLGDYTLSRYIVYFEWLLRSSDYRERRTIDWFGLVSSSDIVIKKPRDSSSERVREG